MWFWVAVTLLAFLAVWLGCEHWLLGRASKSGPTAPVPSAQARTDGQTPHAEHEEFTPGCGACWKRARAACLVSVLLISSAAYIGCAPNLSSMRVPQAEAVEGADGDGSLPADTVEPKTFEDVFRAYPAGALLSPDLTMRVRNAKGELVRSKVRLRAFRIATGFPNGRPGYVIDHLIPIMCGGADAMSNMAWQTIAEGKAKDLWEGDCAAWTDGTNLRLLQGAR